MLFGDISERLAGVPTDVTIEDFEDYADTADFRSQWRTNDSPMDWGIGTSGPGLVAGSQFLECTDPGGGADNAWTLPVDGVLDHYPVRGDEFEFYFTPTGGNLTDKHRTNVWFAAEENTSSAAGRGECYLIELACHLDTVAIDKTLADGTNDETLVNESVTGGFTLDQTYRIEVDFDSTGDGTIGIELFEETSDTALLSGSANDSDYDHGGFGFQGDYEGTTTNAGHFDEVSRVGVATPGAESASVPVLITPAATSAAATPTIETFERGNLDPYTINDATAFAVQQSVVQSGSNALEIVAGNSNTDYMYSLSGLNTYPSEGDTFEFYWRTDGTDGGSNSRIHFASQTETNQWSDGYNIFFDGGEMEIWQLINGGSFDTSDDVSIAWTPGDFNRIEVEWLSSAITATAHAPDETELGSCSIPGGEYTGGGVGFTGAAGNTDTHWYDTWRVI